MSCFSSMNDRWREQAACADRPAGWWVASGRNADEMFMARTICEGCPVRAECAGEALGYIEHGRRLVGTWAGVNVEVRSARAQLKALTGGAQLGRHP